MLTAQDLLVFDKYEAAGSHAFSSGVVSEEDKDAYQEIFSSLANAAQTAIEREPFATWFTAWNVRFGRDGGVQGHRPVDLWASVINRAPEAFGRFPQTYAIASGSGLEIGFAVSIHESDYYNPAVKEKNREIIPILYSKLPTPNSDFVTALDAKLLEEGGWQFGIKARKGDRGDFTSLAQLIEFLQTSKSALKGGGSIYKLIKPNEMAGDFDLARAFSDTVTLFAPLMRVLTPSGSEQIRLSEMKIIHDEAENIPAFQATNLEDGRKKVLRQIAIRQGQAEFRQRLLDAYDFRCAMTGTPVVGVLQAAHIIPYKGLETNSVQNGLLLRADVHNLFDLGLIQINPDTCVIAVSDELKATAFRKLEGRKLRLPKSASHMPSKEALRLRRDMFKWVATAGE